MSPITTSKMSNFRWVICALLFIATTVNYMDRQVLSLTWKDFIAPEFHWTDDHYGTITGLFSIFYAIANLFAGKFVDWMGTKKGLPTEAAGSRPEDAARGWEHAGPCGTPIRLCQCAMFQLAVQEESLSGEKTSG